MKQVRCGESLRARAAVFLVALSLAAVLGGCRPLSSGDAVDIGALQRELEAVVELDLAQQGFPGREVEVSCLGVGDEAFEYTCHVAVVYPESERQGWDEVVSCMPRREPGMPRCVSERGRALQ